MNFRSHLLAAQFLASSASFAQNWCPPGATWAYRYDGWGVDYREQYRYVEDTLMDGLVAKKVEVDLAGVAQGGFPITSQWSEFTRSEDNVIYKWSEAGWDTLYWFGEVGDRWWPIGHPQDCPPMGMLEILGVSNTEINGIMLTTRSIVTIGEDGQAITNNQTLFERFGMTPRDAQHFYCSGVVDYYFPHFVCYSDDEIQVPDGEDCHISLNVVDLGSSALINIQPNPGSSFFQLTGLGDQPTQLRLLDLLGRVTMEVDQAIELQPIDASDLPAGVHLIEMNNETHGRHVLRWVKE